MTTCCRPGRHSAARSKTPAAPQPLGPPGQPIRPTGDSSSVWRSPVGRSFVQTESFEPPPRPAHTIHHNLFSDIILRCSSETLGRGRPEREIGRQSFPTRSRQPGLRREHSGDREYGGWRPAGPPAGSREGSRSPPGRGVISAWGRLVENLRFFRLGTSLRPFQLVRKPRAFAVPMLFPFRSIGRISRRLTLGRESLQTELTRGRHGERFNRQKADHRRDFGEGPRGKGGVWRGARE